MLQFAGVTLVTGLVTFHPTHKNCPVFGVPVARKSTIYIYSTCTLQFSVFHSTPICIIISLHYIYDGCRLDLIDDLWCNGFIVFQFH